MVHISKQQTQNVLSEHFESPVIQLVLTSPDFQSRGQETAVAPWGSCHCTSGTAAPDTWFPAAVTGSTGPS